MKHQQIGKLKDLHIALTITKWYINLFDYTYLARCLLRIIWHLEGEFDCDIAFEIKVGFNIRSQKEVERGSIIQSRVK